MKMKMNLREVCAKQWDVIVIWDEICFCEREMADDLSGRAMDGM